MDIIYLLYQNQLPYKEDLLLSRFCMLQEYYWVNLIRDLRSNYLFFGNNTTLEHCFALG